MSSTFGHQVGGHPSTIQLSPLGSSTLIKPCSPVELRFYQQLGPQLDALVASTAGGGAFIGEWTPAFYGTLSLQGKMGEDGELDRGAQVEAGEASEMIVLENLTHRFVRPNVLDIKLGTQLYDEEASPEKVERMKQAALATTSAQTGVRLTGFQNWNGATQDYTQTPKAFGKALVVEQLEDGIARFLAPFLTLTTKLPPPYDAPMPAPEQKSSEPITPASGVDPSAVPSAPQPGPKPVLEVLEDLASRLAELESILATLPIRMRGGSLLIVTEGDTASLEAALTRENAALEKMRADGGHEDGEDGESDSDDAESVESSDSQGQAMPSTCRSLDVRIIDFAHTRLADAGLGESGGDEGVLLGVQTTRRLVDAIKARVAKVVGDGAP